MQPIDQAVRDEIILQEGNIVISASAGTGKTHTTILKIQHEIGLNHSFRTFAAITFTKKAAKEINRRLLGLKADGFVGTNDNFVLREIISPFMCDVFGSDLKKELNPDYSSGNQISNFKDGIIKAKEMGLICKYLDNKQNFSFQLSLDILKRSEAARRYLQAKYYRIYIDEYQDSDKDMHNLFIYMCKILGIPLFIVGDIKQSIYGWRGGYVTGFKDMLGDNDFTPYRLSHNFRSVISIQNYSNIFMEDAQIDFRKVPFDNGVCCFAYKEKIFAITKIKEWLTIEKPCAFLIRRNNDGKIWANDLKDNSLNFTFIPASPLDNSDIESEHVWIARQMAHYIVNELYSEYDFFDEIPNPEGYNFTKLRKTLQKIEKSTAAIKTFEVECDKLYELLGYAIDDKVRKEVKVLYDIICDEQYIPTYNSEKYKHIVTTVHAAKGLQYEQVIVLAENYRISNEEDLNLHYVAVSRPEKRLLILCNYLNANGKAYCVSVKNSVAKINELKGDVGMSDIATFINSTEFN